MKIFKLLLLLFFTSHLSAQELSCEVKINAPNLKIADPAVIKSLETAIWEFMNTRKWTNDVYEPHEQIDCIIEINIIEDLSTDHFKAEAIIQSSRPVYNSDYHTPVFRFRDTDWEFHFSEYQTLDFRENVHSSNLTSMLAFYAYIILGLDYDSFAAQGGNEFFNKAQNIVNTAQNVSEKGWKAFDGIRNRYWLADNLNSSKYEKFREAVYQYHLQGLDKMYENANEGRTKVKAAIAMLHQIYQEYPSALLLQVFFNAKWDEVIEIFRPAPGVEKADVANMLIQMDATHADKYREMLK